MPHGLRNKLFWIKDWFRGGQVRKHYNAVHRIHQDHGSDYTLGERKKYLSEILRHSLETVPYYRELGINVPELNRFPVVDKNRIKQTPDRFRSSTHLDQKTFKATTSGSTGTPFTVLHDSDKKKRHQADVRFYWEAIGHAWGTKFFYLKIWNDQNRKSKKNAKDAEHRSRGRV